MGVPFSVSLPHTLCRMLTISFLHPPPAIIQPGPGIRRFENLKAGRFENLKAGRFENLKAGRFGEWKDE